MAAHPISDLNKVLELGSIIGEGTFSTVYNGVLLPKYSSEAAPKHLAVKCITPLVEPRVLENELRCLTILEGKNNTIKLLFSVRHKDCLALVMPYYEHVKFNRLIRRFKPSDVRDYMRQLLLAVSHIHQHQIIHRDIKPNNFLYSPKTTKCALVDFGLAEVVSPRDDKSSKNDTDKSSRLPLEDITISNNINNGANSRGRQSRRDKSKKRKSDEATAKVTCHCRGHASVCTVCVKKPVLSAARSGTAGYRPPEVLLKCVEQTTAVDMWACGIMLLSILSGRANFFNIPDDLTNLFQLVTLFGKDALCAAATAMGKNLIVDVPEHLPKATLKDICVNLRRSAKKKGFKSVKNEVTVFPDSAYDLLVRLLALSPTDRITAEQALKHSFITGSQHSPT